jgi:hypothetical protein
MSNKPTVQERYYVVSESELEALFAAGRNLHVCEEASITADQYKAACRAREVPEWATHFWKPVNPVGECEEIKR